MCQNHYLPVMDKVSAEEQTRIRQSTEFQLLGEMVKDILFSDKILNRKALCIALLSRLDKCTDASEKMHYENLFNLLLGRAEAA
ncbi:two-component-system connector protein YcgZ [Pantoea eucrina]|uniref:two-component-system connector protein YcgZ n=1 Tax=Pantoea eucrina TaxID=472693 RepID=UPI000A21FD8C|nr:two-component-system connector protein YcgZ [Pantoea eucrina]ORM79984.1 hypothetical protein HA43_01840 [Pantoea eucrina]